MQWGLSVSLLERLNGSHVSNPSHLKAHKRPNTIDLFSITYTCMLQRYLFYKVT